MQIQKIWRDALASVSRAIDMDADVGTKRPLLEALCGLAYSQHDEPGRGSEQVERYAESRKGAELEPPEEGPGGGCGGGCAGSGTREIEAHGET